MTNDLLIKNFRSGKGACVVIRFPNNRWAVIDCGIYSEPSTSGNNPNPCLKYLIDNNVKNIHFLCLTHPDRDHFIGLSQVINHYRNKISIYTHPKMDLQYVGTHKYKDDKLTKELAAIQNGLSRMQGIQSIIVDGPTWHIKIAPNIFVQIFAPTHKQINSYINDLTEGSEAKTNNISLALYFIVFDKQTGKQFRMLFPGDLPDKRWREITKIYDSVNEFLPVDFIKVGHHGSEDGSPDALVRLIADNREFGNRTVAICGFGNHESLPHIKTLKRLQAHDVNLYCLNKGNKCQPLVKQGEIEEKRKKKVIESIKKPMYKNAIERSFSKSTEMCFGEITIRFNFTKGMLTIESERKNICSRYVLSGDLCKMPVTKDGFWKMRFGMNPRVARRYKPIKDVHVRIANSIEANVEEISQKGFWSRCYAQTKQCKELLKIGMIVKVIIFAKYYCQEGIQVDAVIKRIDLKTKGVGFEFKTNNETIRRYLEEIGRKSEMAF